MKLLKNKKGFLDTPAEVAFLVFCILVVWLLFWVGSTFNKTSIQSTNDVQLSAAMNDYLLVNYLRMPVQCDGKTISVIDCWNYILSTDDVKGKCVEILTEPTKAYFKSANVKQYLVQFFDKEKSPQIRCPLTAKTGATESVVLKQTNSQVELPHPDHTKKILVYLELVQ